MEASLSKSNEHYKSYLGIIIFSLTYITYKYLVLKYVLFRHTYQPALCLRKLLSRFLLTFVCTYLLNGRKVGSEKNNYIPIASLKKAKILTTYYLLHIFFIKTRVYAYFPNDWLGIFFVIM